MSTQSLTGRSLVLLAIALTTAGTAQAATTIWLTKGDGRTVETQFSESDGSGGRVNVFQSGNSAFMFYETWGNDPDSRTCNEIVDQFGNVTIICTYTRTSYDYGWGPIPSTDIQFTATGATLLTTTGAGFSSTHCSTDSSGPAPVTTCGAAVPETFDLHWTTNNLSGRSTSGSTQYRLNLLRFENLESIKLQSAYVQGTVHGHALSQSPGMVGATKGKNVATN